MKIYFWQGLSIIIGFLAMFIVLPYISSNKEIFGVYSLCISLTIFLSYADMGFLSAGYKYASEAFAKNDRIDEVEIIGFVAFVLFIFGLIYSIIIMIFSFNPGIVFSGIKNLNEVTVAKKLFLILSISTFNMLYQRILQIILGIRLEDYILRKISMIANCLNILSSFWFFRNGSYDIVGYYLFMQISSFFASVITTFVVRKKLSYSLRLLMKSFKFNKIIFNRTKGLAFSSLFVTLSWILYYEMDSLFISKFIGVSSLAYYSVCLTLINFIRSLLGTLYGPFNARFNHYKGLLDDEGLKNIFVKVIKLTLPLITIFIITLFMLMKPFIVSWVGIDYINSVFLGKILVLIYAVAYIHYPVGILLITQVRLKELNILSLLNLIVFWVGILASYKYFGVTSFAVFKLITFISSGIFSFYIMKKFLNRNIFSLLWELYRAIIIPCIILIVGLYYVRQYIPLEKSKIIMLQVVGIGGLSAGLCFCIFLIMSKEYRNSIRTFIFSKNI